MSKRTTWPNLGRLARAMGSAGLFALASVACKHTATAPGDGPGCTKDTDCKGDRVCESGHCVEPGAGAAPAAPAAASESTGWFRGGPGGVGPLSVAGPASKPSLVWELDLGAVVFASPTLADGADASQIAYVGTHAGRFVGAIVDGPKAGTLALDMTLSGMVWATAALGPTGRLHVGTDDDKLHAIDPVAAEIVWTLEVGGCRPTRAPGPEGARCDADGGPTVGPDGDLYLGADGVYRIDPAGSVKWKFPRDPAESKHVFSAPAVAKDGRVYFGGQDGFLTALTPEGQLEWQYTIRADVDSSPALGLDGTVYAGADDGRIHAVRRDGSLKWSFVTQKDIRSSVSVARDGTIYATSFDGNLYAIDPDGNVRWVLATDGRIMSTPVIDANGNVLFGSQDDRVYSVTPQGKVMWTVELPGDVDSSVAISKHGTVVVGCDDGGLRAYR